jgi:hypothetical protein
MAGNSRLEDFCSASRSVLIKVHHKGSPQCTRGVGPQIGYNFNLGGVSIYTNLRGYTEFDAYRRVRGYAIFVTVNVPLSTPNAGAFIAVKLEFCSPARLRSYLPCPMLSFPHLAATPIMSI